MRLLLATRNRHKTSEIADLLKGAAVDVVSLLDLPGIPEVDEDQPTLEGNAAKKARESARASGLWALADDTGLEVAALGGEPGVLSARYAGPGCDFAANNAKLLESLRGRSDRAAAFRTVMALSDPKGETVLEEGRLEGMILEAPRGSNGFGYDPIFLVEGSGRTLAEMSLEEKNRVSHRARALGKMAIRIKALLVMVLVSALALPARADKTEPGQTTIWDEIMATQAYRGLRLGSRYLDDRQYEAAEKEFLRAVAASPKDPNAHMMLGAAYYWTGKVDQALAEYRISLDLDPKNAQAHMLQGIAHAWKGDNAAALRSFQTAAELDPKRGDIQMNLGSIHESLGRSSDALDYFRRAVALDPKHPLYHFQLGMLYRRLGRDPDAIEALRQALKLFPAYEDALLELGAADERLGDRKAAIHSFKKAVGIKARDSVARFRLGRLYLLTGDRAKARQIFTDAFHLTPEGEGAGLQLSLSFAGGKKDKPAPPEAGKPQPAQPPPSNDPLDVLARNLERVPAEQGAIMQVDVAFVPKPKLTRADAGETPSSLKKALEKAAGRDAGPKIVRKEFPLPPAAPAQRAEQIEKVIDDLRKTMREAPEDADVRLGMNLTFTRLAQAQTGGGSGKAGGDADGSPKVSFQPRQVGNDMGLWVIGTGWIALIEEVLPEAGREPGHPDEADWWVATGLGFAAIGDGQRALRAFERAYQLEPKSELALMGRGVACVMTGDETGALRAYEEVLKINPKNKPASEGLKWLRRPARTRK